MYEYESGTLQCIHCAKEFLTKDESTEKHYRQMHLEEKTHAIE